MATPKRKPKKLKIPKSLAAVADMYFTVRKQRLAIAKEAEVFAEQEGQLREYLINNLPKSKAEGVQGKLARVTVKTTKVPTVEDRTKFMAFAHRKGNEDLLNETPNTKAIEARWEAGKKVPGVGTFNVVKLSLHEVKK